ncbi:MAG: ATPase domain-containing protein [Candidatus Diapherotrites archaeon]
MAIEKVKTGIQGLDKALEGGIPKNNVVLVSGGAGTGKSTLCMQYLINGAKLFGEKGLYISTEQKRKELIKAGSNYGWDIEGLEQRNLLKIEYFDVVASDNALEKIYDLYTSFTPQRIVLDSLTTFTDSLLVSGMREDTAFSMVQVAESVSPIPRTEKVVAKSLLYHLMNKIRLFDATVILTSELPEKSNYLSADNISEFICDGVMVLEYLSVGASVFRSMRIRKMRYTNHEKGSLPYELGPKGVNFTEKDLEI